ncbi:MAG: hypothetical protein M0Z33_06235, partial [Actinomycetota bacterium]|nr:hypothetical protein [Actinomycetota bacterium]
MRRATAGPGAKRRCRRDRRASRLAALRLRPGGVGRSHAGRAAALLVTLAAAVGSLAALPQSPAAASGHGPTIGTERAATHRLAQAIMAEGLRTQSLVVRYDQAAALMARIDSQIRSGQVQLTSDRRTQARATLRMRALAVDAYVSAATADTASFTSGASVATLPSREVYLGVVTASLDSAATGLRDAQHRTDVAQATLSGLRARTAATLAKLGSARRAAESATAADQSLLRHASRRLLQLVAAANARAAR